MAGLTGVSEMVTMGVLRFSPTGGRRRTANSPKGVLSSSGDRSSARDGGRLALIFGDGGSTCWGLSGNKK
jgi:hypothetical protein